MAEKMRMETMNKADRNFELLKEMFPNAVTEIVSGYDDDGHEIVERAIDKDVLMQEISCAVVEGTEERYQVSWPNKKRAMVNANAPTRMTLRPSIIHYN